MRGLINSTKFITSSYTKNIKKSALLSNIRLASNVTKATDDTHIANPPKKMSYYMKDTKSYNDQVSRNSAYMMVGAYSMVGAMAAKNAVTDFLVNLSASADVLALSKVEVSMATIPEGKNVVIKWQGKPVFIRHRTADEIEEANSVSINDLRHKETDAERVKNPSWLVMLGICTHLGCVPVGEAGEYGGWFCPCHGSHYDISGRIRKGPAPLNLDIPEYVLDEENQVIILG
ncbi:ubiquinol-cytochrome c reductase [Globomyces pollinis-pini]|nr:ubiquinol-cytochrome c reductase [Globomyces pollinis-pini]